MRGVSWFRRRRPQHRAVPAPAVSTQDKIIAAHHGISEQKWGALPASRQRELRDTVAFELRAAS
jgi:hypothetical protein